MGVVNAGHEYVGGDASDEGGAGDEKSWQSV